MAEVEAGFEGLADEDRVYAGSRFQDVVSAVSANPYLAFHAVATDSGTLAFTWEGDNGFAQTESVAITVT